MYKTMPVLTGHGPLIVEMLDTSINVLNYSLRQYRRTFAVRLDLRLPNYFHDCDVPTILNTRLISKFTESLKAQIKADLGRKNKSSHRIQSCDLRFFWVKESCSSYNSHYHVVLFFNKDVYHTLGDIQASTGNLASRIKKAWASALALELFASEGLVNFTNNGQFWVDVNSSSYIDNYQDLFKAMSYLAKAKTKNYSNYSHSFGSSRC
jgi:hypothetical protein